jgi:hypothetical protein
MRLRSLSVVLLALLLAAMAMVPMVSAADEDKILQKWQDEHTIKVTKTVSEKYSDGILTEKISFTGTELTKRFGIDAFTLQKQVKVSAENAKKLELTEGKEKLFTTETTGIFTAADDRPLTAKSGYIPWLFAYSNGVYYQTGDPVNMIWSGASLYTVKAELFEEGWYDYPAEYTYYLCYNGNYIAGDGVADDPARLFGGDHIRLFSLSSGEIVGAAHHDTWVPHSAEEFEWAEDRISAFYSDYYLWHVFPDYTYLGNGVSSPYSNGYAAYIGYW